MGISEILIKTSVMKKPMYTSAIMQIARIIMRAIFLRLALLLKSELVPNDDEKSVILFRCEGLRAFSAF